MELICGPDWITEGLFNAENIIPLLTVGTQLPKNNIKDNLEKQIKKLSKPLLFPSKGLNSDNGFSDFYLLKSTTAIVLSCLPTCYHNDIYLQLHEKIHNPQLGYFFSKHLIEMAIEKVKRTNHLDILESQEAIESILDIASNYATPTASLIRKSEKILARLVESNPQNSLLWRRYVSQSILSGSIEKAITILRKGLKSNPTDWKMWNALYALVRLKKENDPNAMQPEEENVEIEMKTAGVRIQKLNEVEENTK